MGLEQEVLPGLPADLCAEASAKA